MELPWFGFQCPNGWVGFASSDMLGQFYCIRFAGRFLHGWVCWVGLAGPCLQQKSDF